MTEQHAYLERRDATFDDLPDRAATLVVKDKAFHRQFASIYFIRLLKLRPVIQNEAEQRWGKLTGMCVFVCVCACGASNDTVLLTTDKGS